MNGDHKNAGSPYLDAKHCHGEDKRNVELMGLNKK
jgi:hypothetical protein